MCCSFTAFLFFSRERNVKVLQKYGPWSIELAGMHYHQNLIKAADLKPFYCEYPTGNRRENIFFNELNLISRSFVYSWIIKWKNKTKNILIQDINHISVDIFNPVMLRLSCYWIFQLQIQCILHKNTTKTFFFLTLLLTFLSLFVFSSDWSGNGVLKSYTISHVIVAWVEWAHFARRLHFPPPKPLREVIVYITNDWLKGNRWTGVVFGPVDSKEKLQASALSYLLQIKEVTYKRNILF